MTNPASAPGVSTRWDQDTWAPEPFSNRDNPSTLFVIAHILKQASIDAAGRYNRGSQPTVFADLGNEHGSEELSPGHPHAFVDNMLMTYPVGGLQRQEIEQRRGLQPGSFDYNEIPTSSCQSFCWKARQSFDVPFF